VMQTLPDTTVAYGIALLQGRSIKESAADMGVSVANAKVLQHRR
jgi:hypothetical protein